MATCPVCSNRAFEGGFCKKCGAPAPEAREKKSASSIRGAPGGQRFTKPNISDIRKERAERDKIRDSLKRRQPKAKPLPKVDDESMAEKKPQSKETLARIDFRAKAPKEEEPPMELPLDALTPLDDPEPEEEEKETRTCPACGTVLDISTRFCDGCGRKLRALK